MTDLTAGSLIAFTKSDTDSFKATDAVYVGTGGNVNVTCADGRACVIPNVQDGTILPINVTQILSASTTASGFVLMYYE